MWVRGYVSTLRTLPITMTSPSSLYHPGVHMFALGQAFSCMLALVISANISKWMEVVGIRRFWALSQLAVTILMVYSSHGT